jgi:hypothetical protein
MNIEDVRSTAGAEKRQLDHPQAPVGAQETKHRGNPS